MSKERQIGVIQWFNNEKGFGVISTASKDEEYFLHQSNAIDPISSFIPGSPVCFIKGFEKKRLTAHKVRLINKNDLDLIFNHAIINKKVNFQRRITRSNRPGKIFTKVIDERDSLFKISILHLFNEYSEEEVVEISVKFLKFLDSKNLTNQKENIQLLGKQLSLKNFSKLSFDKGKKNLDYEKDLTNLEKVVYEKLKKEGKEKLLVTLWKFDFLTNHSLLDTFSMFGKDTLPFEANYLIKYHDILDDSEIKLLKYYTIDNQILIELFENKYVKKPFQADDLDNLHFYINNFSSVSTDFFDLILPFIDDRLIFDAWINKKYSIDTDRKELKVIPYNEDYKIPVSIFSKFSHEVDFATLSRIQNNYEESDRIIGDLLIEILIKPYKFKVEEAYRSILLIRDEKIKDKVIEVYANHFFEKSLSFLIKTASTNFIKKCIKHIIENETSLKDLSEKMISILGSSECRIKIDRKIDLLSLIDNEPLKKYYRQNIKILSDRNKLQINKTLDEPEYTNLTIDHWNFDTTLLTILLLNSIDFNLINPKSSFRSKLEERVKDYESDEILRIYRATNLSLLIPQFVSKLSFQSQSELESSLDCLRGESNLILEKFSRVYSNLSIEDFSHSLKIFSENDINVPPNIIHNRISNAGVDELSTVFMISDELHNQYPDAIQSGFLELLKKKTNDDLPLLKLIEHSYSPKVIEKVLNLIDVNKESGVLIQLLIQKPTFKQLNASTVEPVLKTLSLKYFEEVIKYACEFHSTIVNNILEDISINPKNINDVLNYIDENEGVGANINESSEFSVIRNFIIEPTNENSIEKLNQLFKNSNYSYQLPVLKYLVYTYYKKVLQKDQLIKILHRIDIVQLSSILFKAFIIEKATNREEMMSKMNLLLKTHFKLISENNISTETYSHIFSLEGLVKKCNGRKRYQSVDLWTGGRQARYYTDGNHTVSTGYDEDIYCEGRLWKEQKFYYKETNKPTGETCNLYWCRNDVCVGINDEVDLSLDFHQWTLNELNNLFDIDLDRLVFTHLAGWLNRMDSIITRLKCYSCDDILRPKNYVPKVLGYYAVPLFNCINNECDKFGKLIRFTHCRGCKKILDSRECETCNNCNWLICDDLDCGKCGCGSNHMPIKAQYPN